MAAEPGHIWVVCGADREGGVQAVFWTGADVGVGCAAAECGERGGCRVGVEIGGAVHDSDKDGG